MTRLRGIFPSKRRVKLARTVKPVNGWLDYLWCYVASEDVVTAHCQLMEASQDLPPHDVYFPNADDTTVLAGARDLVETFRPDLLPVTGRLTTTSRSAAPPS